MILVPESLRPGDQDLIAQAAAEGDFPSLHDCSRTAICEFSRRSGMDLATALLFDRVLRQPANRGFLERITTCNPKPDRLPLVGIVPGAFYREHNNTGADGAEVAGVLKKLGCQTALVPVESFGSLSTNAAIIHQWLDQHSDQQVALVSLSKGTADVKVALGMPGASERFRNVTSWISVSGLPQGTPLVAWLNRQPLRRLGVKFLLWWRRQSCSVVEELSDAPGSPLDSWPLLPPGLNLTHIVSFPLRKHLAHPWAPRAYERLRPLGPNDGGGFLLADVTRLPGVVLPVWGADHYLQPNWDVASLLQRVFAVALSLTANERQTSQSAVQPNIPPASKSNA